MIKLNQIYNCPFCKKQFTVVTGYGFNSYLPVEIINGSEHLDYTYDKDKHHSHLLDCPPLQKKWEETKKRIAKQEKKKNKI